MAGMRSRVALRKLAWFGIDVSISSSFVIRITHAWIVGHDLFRSWGRQTDVPGSSGAPNKVACGTLKPCFCG